MSGSWWIMKGWSKGSTICLIVLPCHFPGGLKKTTKNFSSDIRCSGRVSNWTSPEYRPEELILERTCSVARWWCFLKADGLSIDWFTDYPDSLRILEHYLETDQDSFLINPAPLSSTRVLRCHMPRYSFYCVDVQTNRNLSKLVKKGQEREGNLQKSCHCSLHPEPPMRQWRHVDQAQLTAPYNWHSFDDLLTPWDWCQDCPALIEPSDKTNRTLIRFYGQEIRLHSYFRISLPLLFIPSILPCMQAFASVYTSAFPFISCPFTSFAFPIQQDWCSGKRKLLIIVVPPTHTSKHSMKRVMPKTGSIESMLSYPEIRNAKTNLYSNRSCVAPLIFHS